MTIFEDNITSKVSIEGKYFSALEKYQIPYPRVHCNLQCQSWMCCCSCGQTSWGSLEPGAVPQLSRSFRSFTVSFYGLKVIRSDSSRHSEVGEYLYPFSWGQTEELPRKAGPGEGQVQLQLCSQELQRQAERLRA